MPAKFWTQELIDEARSLYIQYRNYADATKVFNNKHGTNLKSIQVGVFKSNSRIKYKYTKEHEQWIRDNYNNENVMEVWKRMQIAFPNDNIKYTWVRDFMSKIGVNMGATYKTRGMESFVRAVWDPNIMTIERCAKMCSDYFNVTITRPGLANLLDRLGLPREGDKITKEKKMHTILRGGKYLVRIDFRSYTKEQQKIIRERASSEYTVWYINRSLETLLNNNVDIGPGNIIEYVDGNTTNDSLENLEVLSNNTTLLNAHRIMGARHGIKKSDLCPSLVKAAIKTAEVMNI